MNEAVKNAKQNIGKGRNHTETFSFSALPTNLAELKALPEASLDSAFKTVALCVAALCSYEKDINEENWATLYVTSAGADAPRPIKLRRKPSTNQWFINEIQCLADIRIPTSQDEWA